MAAFNRHPLLLCLLLLSLRCAPAKSEQIEAVAPAIAPTTTIAAVEPKTDATTAPLVSVDAPPVESPTSVGPSARETSVKSAAPLSSEPVSPGCKSLTERRDARGGAVNCYPYRCRRGACLTRCKTSDDCVPSSRGPAEFAAGMGWPILCGGDAPPSSGKTSECLPLSPEQVHGQP